MPTREDVIEVLKTVEDPEIGIDIHTLELIYELKIEDAKIYLKMTLTTPFCPYAPMLLDEIKMKLREIEGVKEVQIELTFEPRWQPSDELRAMMGI